MRSGKWGGGMSEGKKPEKHRRRVEGGFLGLVTEIRST